MVHYVTVYFKSGLKDEETYKSIRFEELSSFLAKHNLKKVLVVDPLNQSQKVIKNY